MPCDANGGTINSPQKVTVNFKILDTTKILSNSPFYSSHQLLLNSTRLSSFCSHRPTCTHSQSSLQSEPILTPMGMEQPLQPELDGFVTAHTENLQNDDG
ncbi:hypothetical protein M758_1G040900 [Ceratodon purpureus]|nr:hypothetical protein M758_UG012400 [Ceratodon purpureus]KAG0628627.1 hypothetical protein M758_1G040900 [Ceratodon purpureus]